MGEAMRESFRFWHRLGKPGAGAVVALALILGGEALLHSDAFMYRMRSVFAAGRAFDKVLYVEAKVPNLLVIGNSRVDNGVDPATLAGRIRPGMTAFNLGLPGANASALFGIATRLDAKGLLGPGRIERVLVGLDEGLLQGGDALGYQVFLGNRARMLEHGDAAGALRASVRGWGYADNLKQLREPSKLIQFAHAVVGSVEPIGGGAAERLGYRPGFAGANQDAEQVMRQEVGSTSPPDPVVLQDFWAMLELLRKRGVDVVVAFPPLLTRAVLYIDAAHPAAGPFHDVRKRLAEMDVPMFALESDIRLTADDFINAGHLNDRGAQRFSALLGDALARGDGSRFMRVAAQ